MPDPEDSLGGETFSGEERQDPAEQSLGDGATMGGDTAAHSLGDQSTFGDAHVDDELFDDGMELVDLSTRYTEEGVLGKGGMGEVILATDTRLNRKVAIKRIIGEAARSKTAVQRFLTEAQSIAALNHTNIVQIYEFGRDENGPFLIMECVQGDSLLDKCQASPIELDVAVNIFGQLCNGLAKAHAENIIHRDIKPANILMTEDGIPKLTDFGLAKDNTADTGETMEGAVIGTLDFMPPEQRQGAELTDHRSDLWSLAATFYQMLTGEPPRVIDLDSVPTSIRPMLAKALKSKKEDRFQSAMEMREAILQAHSGKMDTSRSLGEGECPKCATINPPDRKFCRNTECAAALEVDCLDCETGMPMWEGVCGNCGAQQESLLVEIKETLLAKHDEAEQFLNELRFGDALKAASIIGEQGDLRLQQFATWHEDFLARLASSKSLQHARLEELLREALAHEQAYDYEAGLRTLAQVTPSLAHTTLDGISGTAGQLSERLTNNQSRLKTLEGIVREKITKREISDLLPIVAELLALKPTRPEVQKLKTQLDQRFVNQINRLLADGNDQYALGLLENLKTYGLTDEQITLYDRIKAMVEPLPSPSIIPTVNKSQRKVQKEIWKRPMVIGISLVLVIGVLVLSISFMFGSSRVAEVGAGSLYDNSESPSTPSPTESPMTEMSGEKLYELGKQYLDGEDVSKDDAAALRYFRLSAEKGHMGGQNGLGIIYRFGLGGVSLDYEEAMKWFRLSAEQGFAKAQGSIGQMYYFAEGVPLDYTEAMKWFRLSAEQGFADSQFRIGHLYQSAHGVPQDYKKAMKWYRLGAEQGYVPAMSSLGYLYGEGKGVPRDYTEAMKWHRMAAEQGSLNAMRNIGVHYEFGKGIAQDYTEAMKWYRMAAEQGDGPGQGNLARLYREGNGVPADFKKAYIWFSLSVSNGVEKNSRELKAVEEQLSAEDLIEAQNRASELFKLIQEGDSEAIQAIQAEADKASAENAARIKAAAEKVALLARAMMFNKIPAGTFTMGSPATEEDREDNEQQHKVTITKPFYMQTTEVTQGQWQAVMGTEPWTGEDYVKEGDNYPAVYVSWDDAVAYCKKLSEKEGKTYRLPTEAEWEYACRAGTTTRWSFGDDEKVLGDYAWYDKNANGIGERYPHQVRQKKPNAFGLFDMHGNVWEWCDDYYGADYYKQSPEQDPRGPASSMLRVLRGGAWSYFVTRGTRSALRDWGLPSRSANVVGFRLVRELD